MLFYMVKYALQRWLNEDSWNGKINLDYPYGPNIITIGLIGKTQEVKNIKEGNGIMEAEIKVIYFEDGESGHKPRNISDH